MPLDIAAIALSLASTGMKVLQEESRIKLLEYAAHPLVVSVGHLGGEKLLEWKERLRSWYAGNKRIENQDLERAVTRSALLATLFCLLDALPSRSAAHGPMQQLRRHLKKWIIENFFLGVLTEPEESAIRTAIDDCEKRLKDLEAESLVPAGIDPLRLVLPERAGDWSTNLANAALEDIWSAHADLPDMLPSIFRERWFPYLCLAFQEQIKTDARARRVFITLQIATGFEAVKDEFRDFRQEYREKHSQLLGAIRGRPAAAPMDLYASVGAPTQNYVERPELQDRLRALLLGAADNALVALQGMGGIGKTELARKLSHDLKVRESFPDGIVWLDIGRDSGRTLLDRMKEMAEKLNDDPTTYTASNCDTRYRSLLAGKAILVVLDNVWSESDLKPFIPDSPRCRLLFTTRVARIAADVGATDCAADLLSDEQARAVLAKHAGVESASLPPEAANIILQCGSLPQGLAVVGAALRGKPNERWADVLSKLRHRDVPKLLAPTAVSLEEFGKENPMGRECYLQLAVLLENMTATEVVLRTLWGMDAMNARDLMDELESLSLARRYDDGIRIHSLQMDYIRSVYPHREALPLIHEALRLSSHVMGRDTRQFASQMVGRLLPYRDQEGIRVFLERVSAGAPRPWLRPLTPGLTPPGTPLIRTLAGHIDAVIGVAVSAKGRVVLSASRDRTVKVWDLESGLEQCTFQGHSSPVRCVAVSAFGKVAVSGSEDGAVKVWDVEDGCERCTLRGHDGTVFGVAIITDGRMAVTASRDRTLKVWDLESGLERATLQGHSGPVHCVATTTDGKTAVSASDDGTLKVWDLENGLERRTLQGHIRRRLRSSTEERMTAAHLAAEAARAAEDGTPVDRTPVDRTPVDYGTPVYSVAVSANGQVGVSASKDGTMQVWDLESGQERRTFQGHLRAVTGVAMSADGQVVVSVSRDNTLRVWDVESGRQRWMVEAYGSFNDVAVCADPKVVVSAHGDGTLRVWDLESDRERQAVGPHTGPVCSEAVSADGRVAVSASDDWTLKVWDLELGQEQRTLQGHRGEVQGVAVSADGQLAISATADETLQVWDIGTGRERYMLLGHHTGPERYGTGPVQIPLMMRSPGFTKVAASFVTKVAMSADGKVAVSASRDRTVKVWDLENRRERYTLSGHGGGVLDVAVNESGKMAVSASSDGTLKVWDLESGQERLTLEEHQRDVVGVAVSADEKVAVSASFDHTLKVWALEAGTCLTTFYCDGETSCCALSRGVIVAGDDGGRVYFLALEVETTPSRV
jgi:WD40 repeat protein